MNYFRDHWRELCIFLVSGIIIGDLFSLTWKYSNYALYSQIKNLSVKQVMDMAESRQREKYLASQINPEFIKTLKEFTAEVRQENAYLKSFTEVKK